MTQTTVPPTSPPHPVDATTTRVTELEDELLTVRRWMWTWIAIGILVVLVVVGFLVGIVSSLHNIDRGLAEAAEAVTGAGGDVEPLPAHIERINATLSEVHTETEPLDREARVVVDELGAVDTTLEGVDGSLGSIEQTLNPTAASLGDTADVLDHVLGSARAIEAELEAAQNASSLGTDEIWQRVADANVELDAVLADTGDIVPALVSINQHLESTCRALPVPGEC